MKRDFVILLLVIAGLTLMSLWFLGIFDGHAVRPTPESRTIARIKECYFAIGLTGGTRERDGLSILSKAESMGIHLCTGVNYLRMNLGARSALTNDLGTNAVGYGPVLDAWGEPLLVFWRTNTGTPVSGSLSNEDQAILIWSKGPNRTNDWGYGDDVFPHRDK